MDIHSEMAIYNSFFNEEKKKTIIIVSHKLQIANKMDKIYYLEKGQIVESGTHDELLSKRGKYASMYFSQNKF